MKRFLLVVTFGILALTYSTESAYAGFWAEHKVKAEIKKELKKDENELKRILNIQNNYALEKEFDKLEAFYAENYRNSDAFDKKTTFSIIRDNYELYPNLQVATQVNQINIVGNLATADVYEFAKADNIEREDIEMKGELEAFAHTIYYFEKQKGNWLITAEQAIEENNSIIFGEAKYLDINLVAPFVAHAGDSYSSTLSINNLPQNALLMGSISQIEATHPMKADEQEAFRIFEDTELERIFVANRKNINEYNIATIGITRAQPIPTGGIKPYMSGLAFLMTRVNVTPENKYVTKEDK